MEIARAVEANNAAFLLSMGRAGGGAERDDHQLTWTIGGSALGYHNAVVRADLSADEADAAISGSIDVMRAKGVPGSWHVGPSMRPADLGARLLARGFADGGPEPGMALELDRIAEVPTPLGLELERVRDRAGIEAYADVLALGFGEGEREARWAADVFARIGFADTSPWRHYLGRVEGRPVATASVFSAAGVLGIYFVSTAPTFRRRGIGAWITRAALLAGRAPEHRHGVLGSSPMGHPVYLRLGFVEVCAIRVYEWSPSR